MRLLDKTSDRPSLSREEGEITGAELGELTTAPQRVPSMPLTCRFLHIFLNSVDEKRGGFYQNCDKQLRVIANTKNEKNPREHSEGQS